MPLWEGEGAQGAPGNGTREVQKVLSPRLEPVSPRGHQDHPRAHEHPAGQAVLGGLPCPLPQRKQPFGGAASTHASSRDSRARPQAQSSTQPLAQGQTLGVGGGTDKHDNKGSNAFVFNTTTVPSGWDRAPCKALQSLRTTKPFLGSHRAQLRSPALQNNPKSHQHAKGFLMETPVVMHS